jgi:hypothetical protein
MFALILLITLSSSNDSRYLFETNHQFTLRNSSIEVTISKESGFITSILVNGKNTLASNCALDIINRPPNAPISARLVRKSDAYPNQASVSFTYQGKDREIEIQYTIDTIALIWKAIVTNQKNIDQDIDLGFKLPMTRSMNKLFYPGIDQALDLDVSSHVIFAYRNHFYIPVVTGYSPIQDWGISIVAPFEIPKPGLQISVEKKEITVSYQHLRCKPRHKTTVAIEIIPHKPDWRPALGYILKKYPEYFYPAIDNMNVNEGWFYLSFPFVNEKKMQELETRGTSWVELHEYFPFYGLYAPDEEEWTIVIDSDDLSLDRWRKGNKDRDNGYKYMNDLIDQWHKHGVRVYLYFQSFEAWHQYAKAYFPDDIALDRNGNALASWKFTSLMNPDPANKWGKHVLSQASELLRQYPHIDGIFYDRMDYHGYDFAHTDDVTLIDGEPAFMLGFAQERISEKLYEFFHTRGLGVWGNGPTSIEVCQNLDGIMAEKSLRNLTKLQYLGLVRPIIYLPYDNLPIETEQKLKNALICGAFPAVSFGGERCQNLERKYAPLYQLIKNRTWVLEPSPIILPENVQGNIFKDPKGDYIVVIISEDKSQLPPHPFQHDLNITVHLSDLSDIKYAYLLSGDWTGINQLPIVRRGGDLQIKIPCFLASAMILLSRERRYNLVRISSPVLVRGSSARIVFQRSDNHSTKITLSTPWQKEWVMAKDTVEFAINVPALQEGERQMEVGYDNRTNIFSCWVVDPVSISPTQDIYIHHLDGDSIRFDFVNNTENELELELSAFFKTGSGQIVTPGPFRLGPFQNAMRNFFIRAASDGMIQVKATFEGHEIIEEFAVSGRPFDLENSLFYEDFRNNMQNWIVHSGTWKVSNGTANGQGKSHFVYITKSDWRNYSYELTTRCLGSKNPQVNWLKTYLFFRVQDANNFYRFGIHGDAGVVDLYKCVKGKWNRIKGTTFTPEKNSWYTFKISTKGSSITGYIDGKKILEAQDSTFLDGGIGFGVMEDDMECEYKEIVLQPN